MGLFTYYKKKIDLYVKQKDGKFHYAFSTHASKTCKEAKEKFCKQAQIESDNVRVKFDKGN